MTVHMPKRFCKPILRTIWYYLFKKGKNCVIAITGPVGEGKSLTGVKIGMEVDPKFNLKESLVYDVPALIRRSLTMVKIKNRKLVDDITLDEFKKIPDISQWLMQNADSIKIKRGKVIIFDETGVGAFVREFLKLENRTMGKLIQLWRILGIVFIVVVPEDTKLMDSIITKFLNIEILMKNAMPEKGEATSICWAYRGWNKKTNQPIRHRLKGCRWGGLIHIRLLDKEVMKEYERVSKVFKLSAIIHMALEQEIDKTIKIGSTKSIWDDIQYVRQHPKEFTNRFGRITAVKIQTKLNVGKNKAAQIRDQVEDISTPEKS